MHEDSKKSYPSVMAHNQMLLGCSIICTTCLLNLIEVVNFVEVIDL